MKFKMEPQHTLAGSWQELAKKLKLKSNTVQYREMEQAYYAGATHMLRINDHIGKPEVPEDHGFAILTAISQEVANYFGNLATRLRSDRN